MSRVSKNVTVDPNEWAAKKKAQMERAKQLKEERKNSISEGATFTPQTNPRRPSLNGKHQDSLDKLTNEAAFHDPLDIPIPTVVRGQSQNEYQELPSPNSDALGREMKKFGGGGPAAAAVPAQPAVAPGGYQSKFLQQYTSDKQQFQSENSLPNQASGRGSFPESKSTGSQAGFDPVQDSARKKKAQEEADEVFMSNLRGGGGPGPKRSSAASRTGPGWNDDTSTAGVLSEVTGTFQAPPAPTTVVKRAPRRAAAGGGVGPSSTSNTSWNTSSELTPRTAGEVKSNLSLLKSKIRQSESAGTGTAGGGSGGYSQGSYGYGGGNSNSSQGSLGGGGQHGLGQGQSSYSSNYHSQQQQQQKSSSYSLPRGEDFEEEPFQSPPQQMMKKKAAPARRPVPMAAAAAVPAPPSSSSSSMAFARPPSAPHGTIAAPPAISSSSSSYQTQQGQPQLSYEIEDEDGQPSDQQPMKTCPSCQRRFNPSAYAKHVKICEKVFLTKRKAFDSTKMRIADNPELLQLHRKAAKREGKGGTGGGTGLKQAMKLAKGQGGGQGGGGEGGWGDSEDVIVAAPAPSKSKVAPMAAIAAASSQPIGEAAPVWKQQSSAFREAMKAARQYAQAKASGAPLPPPVAALQPDPSLVPCPHCQRRFNAKAAERHIPQCQNIIAKPSTLKRGTGINAANCMTGTMGSSSSQSQSGKKGGAGGKGRF